MERKEIISKLCEKCDKPSYDFLLKLESNSLDSNEMYKYFDDFLNMLDDEKSFVRIRGFRLICSLSRWDIDNKINRNINKILLELDDEKPIAVRQCLAALNNILLYKVELSSIIKDKLLKIDYLKYKDSMSPLIKKDIENIINNIGI